MGWLSTKLSFIFFPVNLENKCQFKQNFAETLETVSKDSREQVILLSIVW